MALAGLSLAFALAAYALFLKGRLAERFGFAGRSRSALYWFWVAKGAALFVVPSLIILALLGALPTLAAMPMAFAQAASSMGLSPGAAGRDPVFLATVVGGLVGGALLGAAIARWRMARRRRPWMLGNLTSVLPARRSDLPAACAVAIGAGVSEELFFRLTLPLLFALLTGSALIGFALSALLFAAAHRYQGVTGMAASTALAAIFTGFYWMTGSLWMTMALHALVDLNGLVVRPLVLGIRA